MDVCNCRRREELKALLVPLEENLERILQTRVNIISKKSRIPYFLHRDADEVDDRLNNVIAELKKMSSDMSSENNANDKTLTSEIQLVRRRAQTSAIQSPTEAKAVSGFSKTKFGSRSNHGIEYKPPFSFDEVDDSEKGSVRPDRFYSNYLYA